MSIHEIASQALDSKTLTAQQEHEIAMLLRQGCCTALDRSTLSSLFDALRQNRVRYANPQSIQIAS